MVETQRSAGGPKAFWDQVNQIASELQGEVVFLMSLDNHTIGTVAGAIVECPRKLAAQALVRKTHRLAEPKEIKAWEAEQRRKAQQISDEEYKRKQQFALPTELTDLISGVTRMAQQSVGKQGKPAAEPAKQEAS